MKGILLAGGTGSRLYPITSVASKHLMPIYDKPMIYYPLSTLMLAGIREIALITTSHDLTLYQRLLGDGSRLGISITYLVQEKAAGIAQAFQIADEFIDGEPVCLILGDNFFYGDGMQKMLQVASKLTNGALIFGYRVKDPERYGVVEFDDEYNVIDIVEKPQQPKSNFAVPGLYFYDRQVVEIVSHLKPSGRGELEITDVNKRYLEQKQLRVSVIGRGIAWFDTGTPASFVEATNYVMAVESRQGLKISCLEEIAHRQGFIDDEQLLALLGTMSNSAYRQSLQLYVDTEVARPARYVSNR